MGVAAIDGQFLLTRNDLVNLLLRVKVFVNRRTGCEFVMRERHVRMAAGGTLSRTRESSTKVPVYLQGQRGKPMRPCGLQTCASQTLHRLGIPPWRTVFIRCARSLCCSAAALLVLLIAPLCGFAQTNGASCSVPNGKGVWQNGVCQIQSCNAGFMDCNRMPQDGCETNVNTDPNNCGSCGRVVGPGMSCTDLTGQSVPDSMRWRGESLETMHDHSAQ